MNATHWSTNENHTNIKINKNHTNNPIDDTLEMPPKTRRKTSEVIGARK